MANNYTENYGLCQWEATDQVLREEFNEGYTKIDAALKAQADDLEAEVSARKEGDNAAAAANCLVKLLEKTLEVETQKWDIDMSGINLTKYQKLILYPHLKGNNNQWVDLHINGTDGKYARIPLIDDSTRQNFGAVEITLTPELPRIFIYQIGVTSVYQEENTKPSFNSYLNFILGSGVTHLDTLNLWFDMPTYFIQPGSTIQIYGIQR